MTKNLKFKNNFGSIALRGLIFLRLFKYAHEILQQKTTDREQMCSVICYPFKLYHQVYCYALKRKRIAHIYASPYNFNTIHNF